MYWLYSLPNWAFEILTLGLFVAFGLAGLFPTRRLMRRVHHQHSYNDIVGFYLAGITVLYGVSLGLLAIAAWETYTVTQAKVSQEAAALFSLYRTLDRLPEPTRSVLQADLRQYTRQVIDVAWPQQRRGIVPAANNAVLEKFETGFGAFVPSSQEQNILAAEITHQFDDFDERRSVRLDSVGEELPPPLWLLILLGAGICIIVTWFFLMESMTMHIWMTVLMSMLLGLMVFMVAALDNPYRGEVSVSPAPFERVYALMNKPGR